MSGSNICAWDILTRPSQVFDANLQKAIRGHICDLEAKSESPAGLSTRQEYSQGSEVKKKTKEKKKGGLLAISTNMEQKNMCRTILVCGLVRSTCL